jgi:hypothetical protein
MDFHFGSQFFQNVQIPLLWGSKAILSHPSGALSIIDLDGSKPTIEVVGDKPASSIEHLLKEDGFVVYSGEQQSYFYSPDRKLLRDFQGVLPECELHRDYTRIGSNKISNSMISGSQVGIGVTKDGFFIGGPLPEGLHRLGS